MLMMNDHRTNSGTAIELKNYNLMYTRCYCEENIYLLCKEISERQNDLLKYCSVIYISNEDRKVPLWEQKAGGVEEPVIWDYHVILFFQTDSRSVPLIYDYDTLLSFPCPADEYTFRTFKPELALKKQFDRCFRLIPAEVYLSEFASDRSHMKKKDGTYYADPPTYPQIKSGSVSMNLNDYIYMNEYTTDIDKARYGKVKNLDDFCQLVL